MTKWRCPDCEHEWEDDTEGPCPYCGNDNVEDITDDDREDEEA